MILWFRRDLRIEDSKILSLAQGRVLPIFIFDKNILNSLDRDDKRVSLIFREVLNLKKELQSIGLNLAIFYAEPKAVFEYLIEKFSIKSAITSVDFDSYAIQRDREIEELLELKRVNDSFIFDADDILKDDGSTYKVFTSYYRKSLTILNSSLYMEYSPNKTLELREFEFDSILEIKNALILKKPIEIESINFDLNEPQYQTSDEILSQFKFKVGDYALNRDFLFLNSTSKLSLHLRFGLVSIRKVLRILKEWQNENKIVVAEFYRQLIWREFFNYILIHNPKIENENFLNLKIDWENDESKWNRFINAKTGVPIVDSAIIELKTTGYMHNRARMVVGSFLTKDLHIDWKFGERFFAKYLLDFESSSNISSWQWVSGVGVDAQPFFRIFNPYLQSKKFDVDAIYIKRYLKELKHIDSKILHSEELLKKIDIPNYPKPMINHKFESNRAKEMYKKI